VLALVVFVFALHWTFPYRRVADKMVDALAERYDVTYADVGRGFWPGSMRLKGVALRSKQLKPDDKVTTLYFSEVKLDVGILALLGRKASVDIDASLGGGSIEGNVVMGKDYFETEMTTHGLPLGTLPFLHTAIGLPMDGKLNLDIHLRVPAGNWKEAEGRIGISCPGCTVGDGVEKIKPKARPGARSVFANDGITVPKLDLGNFTGEIEISKGKGVIKKLGATSKDGELTVTGELVLARKFIDSTLPGCIRFKISDDLKKREPNFGNIQMVLGVALDAEGYSNLRIRGKVNELKYLGAANCKGGAGEAPEDPMLGGGVGGFPGRPSRPSINGIEPGGAEAREALKPALGGIAGGATEIPAPGVPTDTPPAVENPPPPVPEMPPPVIEQPPPPMPNPSGNPDTQQNPNGNVETLHVAPNPYMPPPNAPTRAPDDIQQQQPPPPNDYQPDPNQQPPADQQPQQQPE
jgi:type II secretion system protein N